MTETGLCLKIEIQTKTMCLTQLHNLCLHNRRKKKLKPSSMVHLKKIEKAMMKVVRISVQVVSITKSQETKMINCKKTNTNNSSNNPCNNANSRKINNLPKKAKKMTHRIHRQRQKTI